MSFSNISGIELDLDMIFTHYVKMLLFYEGYVNLRILWVILYLLNT